MTLRGRVHFLLLAIVFFSCFFVSIHIAWTIGERAYVVLVYGWDNSHKYGLHVTRSKPVIVVSNGDRASEATTFLFGVVAAALTFTILFASFGVVARFTALLGRRIHPLTTAGALSNLPETQALPRTTPADVLLVIAIFGLSILMIHLIIGATLLQTICNHAIFLAAASIVLRLAFAGSPPSPEPRPHSGSRVRREGQA